MHCQLIKPRAGIILRSILPLTLPRQCTQACGWVHSDPNRAVRGRCTSRSAGAQLELRCSLAKPCEIKGQRLVVNGDARVVYMDPLGLHSTVRIP